MNVRQVTAALALTGAIVATGQTTASARSPRNCGKGRIILATSEMKLRCHVKASQRLDLLIPAGNFGEALDKCDFAGGQTSGVIFRLNRDFGGIRAGAVIRCNNVDF